MNEIRIITIKFGEKKGLLESPYGESLAESNQMLNTDGEGLLFITMMIVNKLTFKSLLNVVEELNVLWFGQTKETGRWYPITKRKIDKNAGTD